MKFFSEKDSLRLIYDYQDVNEIIIYKFKQKNQNKFMNHESPNPNNVNVSKDTLFIHGIKNGESLQLSFSYDCGYFSEAEIKSLCNIINSYLSLIVDNPLEKVKNLKIN